MKNNGESKGMRKENSQGTTYYRKGGWFQITKKVPLDTHERRMNKRDWVKPKESGQS